MKYLTIRIAIILITALMLSCNSSTSEKNTKKRAAQEISSDLKFKMSTDKTAYEIGEPVYATVHLKNNSKNTINIFGLLNHRDGALQINIKPDNKKSYLFVPLSEADHDHTAMIELKPGESIAEAFPIFFGGNKWSFPKNGTYEITATYKTIIKKGTISSVNSNKINLNISVNKNEVLSKILSGNKASYESGLFMTWQAGDHLTKGQNLLKQVLASSPKTNLNNYINLAFGKCFSEPFMYYRLKEPRKADYFFAEKYLDKVEVTTLPKYLKIQYHLARIRCNYNQSIRNKKMTLDHFSQLKPLISNDIAYQRIGKRIKKMRQRIK